MQNNSLHIDTPLLESVDLSRCLGKSVYLKMEALQPSGSFKIRGVGHICQKAFARGIRKFVAASGGNAGLALAFASRRLGVEATVVVPESSPKIVREKLQAEGAKVVVAGKFWDEAHKEALRICEVTNATYVHPFDDEVLWDGHASMIDELKARDFKPGAIVLSVGGGGLLCGVLTGLHRNGWLDIPVVAVETEGAACLFHSIKAGRMVPLEKIDTIASTLASRVVTLKALEWAGMHKILPFLVSDRQALSACRRFLTDHRVLVEPACGAALAAVYDCSPVLDTVKNLGPVLVIACGGSGTSTELFDAWDKALS